MDANKMKYFKGITDFFSVSLGGETDTLLYLLEDNEKFILIDKNINSEEKIGSELEETFVESVNKNKDQKDFLPRLFKKEVNGRISRTSIYFIKEKTGKLIGLFCLKRDITDMIIAANYLNTTLKSITGGPERNIDDEITRKENKVEDTIEIYSNYIVEDYFSRISFPVEAMTIEDKKKIVYNLNQKGIFQIKGNIAEIAKRLKISEKTVYRYLSKK